MNLFVLGSSPAGSLAPGGARAALEAVAERLGFWPGRAPETWSDAGGNCVLAWIQHDPEQVGGVRYVSAGERGAALFSGRPIRWSGVVADGRAVLDPAALAGADPDALDGRFVAARTEDRDWIVVTDPLGAYPVFAAEAGGARWVSNNPRVLAALTGAGRLRPAALAGLVGGGWPLAGDPVVEGVERLPAGAVHRVGSRSTRPYGPGAAEIASMLGAGFDARAAADTLVAALRALADWPGRPNVVPVTGGRDSRLVLAAALHGGFEFEATTGGPPDAPDVVVGRALCERAGIPHVPLAGDPGGDMWQHPRRMAEVVDLLAAGTACVADAAGFPLAPRSGPLVLWHSGQGGEIARGYYARAAARDAAGLADGLYRAFTGRRPGRRELLSERGEALVRDEVERWVDEQLAAGIDPADVPDVFYLRRRMATWAGPSHTCVEPVKDTTAPLWSARMLPHMLGLPRGERALERFHLRVLEQLAPDLVDVPFEGGGGWPEDRSALALRAARVRTLASKAAAEARRRAMGAVRRGAPAGPRAEAAPPPADPFAAVHAQVSEAVRASGDDPAWEILDRARVERLLDREPATLDTMSRYYVWRLGQALWSDV